MNITYVLIGITVLISFLAFSNRELLERAMFHPYEVKKKGSFFKFLSHGFIHADMNHLLFNMITLFFFGPNVEAYFQQLFPGGKGNFYFVMMYLLAIIVSSIPAYVKNQENPYYRSLGASGAVSAVLFSAVLFAPLSKIYLFFIPIGIPAFVFGFLYLAYSAYMAKRGRDNIGHDAHFVGAVFGLLFTIALAPYLFNRFIETVLNAIGA